MLRLLIASPYPAMRAGLRALLEAEKPAVAFQIIGAAETAEAAQEWARTAQPHVLIYDLALDATDELDGLWRLRRAAPAPAILALAEVGQTARMVAALQAGARGCLPKTAGGPELTEAVLDLASGETILPATATAALLGRLRGDELGVTLSPRESDVLRGVAGGQTNKAIALKLGISEHTVKFHLGGAMTKLSAASRAEAVASALRLGLISV